MYNFLNMNTVQGIKCKSVYCNVKYF